jgi:hypothetical protein
MCSTRTKKRKPRFSFWLNGSLPVPLNVGWKGWHQLGAEVYLIDDRSSAAMGRTNNVKFDRLSLAF